MEKVKVTQEQAEAIEKYKESDTGIYDFLHDLPLGHMTNKSWKDVAENQEEMLKIMSAFVNGNYEIEPEFKEGEWVNDAYGFIKMVVGVDNEGIWLNEGGVEAPQFTNYSNSHYRAITHATTHEIKREKRRIWWAKHDREVWELKEGDLLEDENYELFEVKGKSEVNECWELRSYEDGHIYGVLFDEIEMHEVVCFAEDRKDL